MTNEPRVGELAAAYVNAPDIDAELDWLRACTAAPEFELSREFCLRRAALLDRLVLREAANYGLEATAPLARTAELAGRCLVEHDIEHEGLSPKGAELVTGDDHRDYVRHAYRAWSAAQTH